MVSRKLKPVPGHELLAILRYGEFKYREGLHLGNMSRVEELSLTPAQLSFDDPTAYDAMFSDGLSVQTIKSLTRFVQAELGSTLWGRVLFYIVMGDEELEFGTFPFEERVPISIDFDESGKLVRTVGLPYLRQSVEPIPTKVYLSKLPHLLLPKRCISPECDNDVRPAEGLHKIKYLCGQDCLHQYKWKKIQTLLRDCFNCLYKLDLEDKMHNDLAELNPELGFNRSTGLTPQEAFSKIWKGYVEICRYLSLPEQDYIFRKSSLSDLVESARLAQILHMICLLPHEVPETDSTSAPHKSGFNSFPHSLESIDLVNHPMWTISFSATDEKSTNNLPSIAFDMQKIKVEHTAKFKFISRFHDDKKNPLNWNMEPDAGLFVLLEELDDCLNRNETSNK